MEYNLRKQKRLGPAPIASFEKSFEDSSTSTGAPELSRQDAVRTTPEDSDKKDMDPEISGPTAAITMTSTRISTVTMHSGSASPTRRHHQHDPNDPTSKRPPPPLQAVNISDSIQSATRTTVSSGDGHFSGVATLGVNTASTPRIDISRASSSSQHEDSRESSPDNVFEQVGTGTLQESLGFREEGAMDLRSSTEELYFMDPEQKKEEQEKLQQTRKSPIIFKFDEHQNYLQQHQRKDSASSEVAALLCISGRTSRISSVGSQGSAVSRLSAVSGISRSPSPHKMLLETSFCGPKPLENIVDGSIVSTVEPPTAEVLEQVLLSRKHDPTQAVFAEGIKIESSPKKNLANGETAKRKPNVAESIRGATKPVTANRPLGKKVPIPTIGVRKDAAKRVVGALPSGAEYIRINLKPDYLYEDKGMAPNERIVEISKSGKNSNEHKKPITLSLARDPNAIEQRLTPSSSPKPARHQALAREPGGSRSPSPATVTVSRKSSFCSLFKPKDSPDSPHEQPRSRSKSRDRSTPQSQSGTPSKQKSVLAIFKPKRSVSKSKCSSPIDHDAAASSLDGISQVEFKFKSEPAGSSTESRSRPSSRLRYYDTPLDGKSIHIPLHTPPDEKQDRKFMPSNKESKEPEPPPPSASSSGSSHTTMGPTPPSSAKLQPAVLEANLPRQEHEKPPALPLKTPKLAQLEKTQRIVNLDAIQSLSDDKNDRGRTWSLEVHKHSSQESQETTSMDSSNSTGTQRRKSKPNLSDVAERPSMENSIRQESYEHAVANDSIPNETINHQNNIPTTKEKKRLLFSMRLGSGSQEQIFSTQFSISKTESLSSQLSEQQSIPESPGPDGKQQLQRSDTVIRRTNDSQPVRQSGDSQSSISSTGTAKRKPSTEDVNKPTVVGVIEKKDSSDDKRKSKTSDEEDKRPTPTAVVMRRKDNSSDSKRKSKSASEEDDSTNRHSRYIESFDVKRGIPDLKAQSRHSSDSSIKERDSRTSSREDQDPNTPVAVPQLPPKLPVTERQSMMSTTDDLAESSESERDSEMDPNRIKRHLPRHIGAVEDHESTGLVSQDSFEDELPYVPTTLPEERAFGVPLLSMKDRATMEVKTCPVDRPRSTTPMNPACLEEYCGIAVPDDPDHVPVRGEKLRISLPRKDSTKDKSQWTKSPRRVSNTSGKSWFEFAEQGLGRANTSATTTPTQFASPNQPDDELPPPLPPRKPSGSSGGQWINFENIPEKRKAPKRITALPKDSSLDFTNKTPNSQSVQYNYVKPEECQCECHEVERESHKSPSLVNVDLLQQGEDMQPLLESETHDGVEPSDSSVDYSYEQESRPFQMDLPLGPNDGNVFNVSSQQLDSPDERPSRMNDGTPNRSNNNNRKKKPTDS